MLFETELKNNNIFWSEVTSKRMWGESRQMEVTSVSTVGESWSSLSPTIRPREKEGSNPSLAPSCVPLGKPF